MPKSLAFEFYLMKLCLEHNTNIVKQKNLTPACTVALRAIDPPPRGAPINRASWREAATTRLGWTGMRNFLYKRPSLGAQVAQLVEQRTENPCVGGSIPPLGTIRASQYLTVLCCVEALDGFDEDTFCYQHRPALRSPLSARVSA